jgi:hypothetical protein
MSLEDDPKATGSANASKATRLEVVFVEGHPRRTGSEEIIVFGYCRGRSPPPSPLGVERLPLAPWGVAFLRRRGPLLVDVAHASRHRSRLVPHEAVVDVQPPHTPQAVAAAVRPRNPTS